MQVICKYFSIVVCIAEPKMLYEMIFSAVVIYLLSKNHQMLDLNHTIPNKVFHGMQANNKMVVKISKY